MNRVLLISIACTLGIVTWLLSAERDTSTKTEAALEAVPATKANQQPSSNQRDDQTLEGYVRHRTVDSGFDWQRVELDLQDRDPRVKYSAYKQIALCVRDSEQRELLKSLPIQAVQGETGKGIRDALLPESVCAELTEATRRARLAALAIAAEEGVAGAAINFLAEGPAGDPTALEQRAADPIVRDWKAAVFKHLLKSAENGEVEAQLQLAALHLDDRFAARDPEAAVQFYVAGLLGDPSAKEDLDTSVFLQKLKFELGDVKYSKAKRRGEDFFVACCKKPGGGSK